MCTGGRDVLHFLQCVRFRSWRGRLVYGVIAGILQTGDALDGVGIRLRYLGDRRMIMVAVRICRSCWRRSGPQRVVAVALLGCEHLLSAPRALVLLCSAG